MPYAIDTAATIADLESAGVEPSQAKAIAQAINGAAGDSVSKEDFRELRGEFRDLRGEFKDLRGEFRALEGKFEELREAMDHKFVELREDIDRKFATKADLAMLRKEMVVRIVASQVATAALLFMLLKFFG